MTLKVNALFTLPSKLHICAIMDRQIDTSFFFLKEIYCTDSIECVQG